MEYFDEIFRDPVADLVEKTAAPFRFLRIKYAQVQPEMAQMPTPPPEEQLGPAEPPAEPPPPPPPETSPPPDASLPEPPMLPQLTPRELLEQTLTDFEASPVASLFLKPAQPITAPSQSPETPIEQGMPEASPGAGTKYAARMQPKGAAAKVKLPPLRKQPIGGRSAEQMLPRAVALPTSAPKQDAWAAPAAAIPTAGVAPPVEMLKGKVNLDARQQEVLHALSSALQKGGRDGR